MTSVAEWNGNEIVLTVFPDLSGLRIVGSSTIPPLGVFVAEHSIWRGQVIWDTRRRSSVRLGRGLLDVCCSHCCVVELEVMCKECG